MSVKTVLAAVSLLNDLTAAAAITVQQINKISKMIQKASIEGRTDYTDDEWKEILAADDLATVELERAIANRKV